jgi:3-hydroxyacyl-[acyl-carrier-protein] dehydratase
MQKASETKVTEPKVLLTAQQIKEVLPHRYPFLMLDKVIELIDNEKVVAIKCVTQNEEFFQGHFPNRPVMPGVLILEAMAQAGAILATLSEDGVKEGKYVYLVGATDVRWKRAVVPGDVLTIEMTSEKKRRPLWVMRGEVRVDGQLAASAVISAMEA